MDHKIYNIYRNLLKYMPQNLMINKHEELIKWQFIDRHRTVATFCINHSREKVTRLLKLHCRKILTNGYDRTNSAKARISRMKNSSSRGTMYTRQILALPPVLGTIKFLQTPEKLLLNSSGRYRLY